MTERPPPDDPPLRDDASLTDAPADQPPEVETCDWCGSADLWWRNCKLLCRNCGGIVKSCADL
jgi:purine nucleoside permease